MFYFDCVECEDFGKICTFWTKQTPSFSQPASKVLSSQCIEVFILVLFFKGPVQIMLWSL